MTLHEDVKLPQKVEMLAFGAEGAECNTKSVGGGLNTVSKQNLPLASLDTVKHTTTP